MQCFFISFIFLSLPIFSAATEETIVLHDDTSELSISGHKLEYYLDPSCSITFDQLKTEATFQPLENSQLGQLDHDADIWLRFSIKKRNVSNKDWLIYGWPSTFQVTLYEQDTDGPINSAWRSRGDIPRNELKSGGTIGQYQSLSLSSSGTATTRYYLRIGMRRGWFTGIKIGTTDQFAIGLQRRTVFFGIFYGMVLTMFIYNLVLFFSIHDRVYLWYTLYLICMGFYFVRLNGFSTILFPGVSSTVLFHAGLASLTIGMISAVQFTRLYLGLDTTKGVLNKISYFIILIWAVVGLSSHFIDPALVSMLNSVAGILSAIMLIIIGIIRLMQHFRHALFYIVAWGFLCLAGIFYSLVPFRILSITSFTTSLLQIGTAGELLLLSLSLGYRVKILGESRDFFKQGTERYKALSTLDPLTGLLNRREFDQILVALTHSQKVDNEIFSAIFIDIDDFKKINDTYGHRSGDMILIEVSSIIKQNLRETDQPFRYGGEEFVLLLPATNSIIAATIGERIRKSIEEHDFVSHDDESIAVTISLGVAEAHPTESSDELLKRADAALYDAKATGKNMVITAH